MELSLRNGDRCRYLSFSGRLDSATSPEAEQALRGKLDDCRALLVDLGDLDYISSAGLRVLLIIAKRMQSNRGKLVLCRLRPDVKMIFEVSGLTSIFNIFDDLQSAENAVCC